MPEARTKPEVKQQRLRNLEARAAYLQAHPNKVPPQVLRQAIALLEAEKK